jgi:hypothetical protein
LDVVQIGQYAIQQGDCSVDLGLGHRARSVGERVILQSTDQRLDVHLTEHAGLPARAHTA